MLQPKKSAMIIGRQPLVEALRSGRAVERIYLLRQSSGDTIRQIKQLAEEYHVPVNLVPAEKLDSLSKGNHQGCIALAGIIRYLDLQDVISFVHGKGETPLFLLVDSITDVRNIGAIARSALCCGAHALILPEKGVAPLNEEALKASAGALEHLEVCRVEDLAKAVDTLRLNGIRVMAADQQAKELLFDCRLDEPLAVILGSEHSGVQPSLLNKADGRFSIPMAGNFDSFNVSVAAGIILYEALRQRLMAAPTPK